MACFTHPSLVPTFNGLQFRRWQCGPIFICLAVVGSQICEIPQNSEKIWAYSSSRSSKVIDLGVNQKHICDLLLVISHWPYLLSFSIHRRLKLENASFTHPSLVWCPRSGAPIRISGRNLPCKNYGENYHTVKISYPNFNCFGWSPLWQTDGG